MIAAGDDVQRDSAVIVAMTGCSSSGVPNVSRSPLHDQHAARESTAGARPRLVGSPGGCKRIAERDDALQTVEALRAEVRRHAAAHRLAADEHARPRRSTRARRRSTSRKQLLEHRRLVGHVPPLRACRESRT